MSCDGQHYYVSDEYGPGVFEFSAHTGRRTRAFSLPPRFAVSHPAATGAAELTGNASGRQANHGLEGLAISPDGRTLVVILQSPLLQDTAAGERGHRVGINVRLLTIDIATGQTQEYLYQLADGKTHGVSEIVAVNNHEFLVLERDAKAGKDAECKIAVSDRPRRRHRRQPTSTPCRRRRPADVRPVAKRLFLDLLDPRFGLAGPRFAGQDRRPGVWSRPGRRPASAVGQHRQRFPCLASRAGYLPLPSIGRHCPATSRSSSRRRP